MLFFAVVTENLFIKSVCPIDEENFLLVEISCKHEPNIK